MHILHLAVLLYFSMRLKYFHAAEIMTEVLTALTHVPAAAHITHAAHLCYCDTSPFAGCCDTESHPDTKASQLIDFMSHIEILNVMMIIFIISSLD